LGSTRGSRNRGRGGVEHRELDLLLRIDGVSEQLCEHGVRGRSEALHHEIHAVFQRRWREEGEVSWIGGELGGSRVDGYSWSDVWGDREMQRLGASSPSPLCRFTCAFAALVGHEKLDNCKKLQGLIVHHIDSILEEAVSQSWVSKRTSARDQVRVSVPRLLSCLVLSSEKFWGWTICERKFRTGRMSRGRIEKAIARAGPVGGRGEEGRTDTYPGEPLRFWRDAAQGKRRKKGK